MIYTNHWICVKLLIVLCLLSLSSNANIIHYFEDFNDEILEGRNIPDLDIEIDPDLSSPFSSINQGYDAWGMLTLRDRI